MFPVLPSASGVRVEVLQNRLDCDRFLNQSNGQPRIFFGDPLDLRIADSFFERVKVWSIFPLMVDGYIYILEKP